MKGREIVSVNLKNYRKKYGLSQSQMAALTGLSVRGIGKIERREVAAEIDSLDKISSGLDISISDLLTVNFFTD